MNSFVRKLALADKLNIHDDNDVIVDKIYLLAHLFFHFLISLFSALFCWRMHHNTQTAKILSSFTCFNVDAFWHLCSSLHIIIIIAKRTRSTFFRQTMLTLTSFVANLACSSSFFRNVFFCHVSRCNNISEKKRERRRVKSARYKKPNDHKKVKKEWRIARFVVTRR